MGRAQDNGTLPIPDVWHASGGDRKKRPPLHSDNEYSICFAIRGLGRVRRKTGCKRPLRDPYAQKVSISANTL
jgi:hypothetical protein